MCCNLYGLVLVERVVVGFVAEAAPTGVPCAEVALIVFRMVGLFCVWFGCG